jgi:hypothetical protein
MQSECSLPQSQAPATCSYTEPIPVSYRRIIPSLRPRRIFWDILSSYGEELLASHPPPKLDDYPLSAARGCVLMYS